MKKIFIQIPESNFSSYLGGNTKALLSHARKWDNVILLIKYNEHLYHQEGFKYKKYRNLIHLLYILKKQKSNYSFILCSTSPLSNIFSKIFYFINRIDFFEYSPFSEYPILDDRPHHFFCRLVNRITVKKRILLRSWQANYSEVRDNFFLPNLL